PQEAIEKAEQAVKLAPFSVLPKARLGACYQYSSLFDDGDREYRRALELEPRFSHAYLMFAWTLEQHGQYEKALQEVDQALHLVPDDAEALSSKGRIYALLQRRKDALAIIEQLNSIGRTRYVSRTLVADVHAALGNKDDAMAELEKGFAERSPYIPHLSDRQTFVNLRSDPRFVNLLDRLNITR